ncbi:hypothetical protein RCL1_005387 [Eukaryota sp. TZLM3-RCL]
MFNSSNILQFLKPEHDASTFFLPGNCKQFNRASHLLDVLDLKTHDVVSLNAPVTVSFITLTKFLTMFVDGFEHKEQFVLIIDCEGCFPIVKLLSFLKQYLGSSSDTLFDKLSERILVSRCSSSDSLRNLLDSIAPSSHSLVFIFGIHNLCFNEFLFSSQSAKKSYIAVRKEIASLIVKLASVVVFSFQNSSFAVDGNSLDVSLPGFKSVFNFLDPLCTISLYYSNEILYCEMKNGIKSSCHISELFI